MYKHRIKSKLTVWLDDDEFELDPWDERGRSEKRKNMKEKSYMKYSTFRKRNFIARKIKKLQSVWFLLKIKCIF